MPLNSKTRSPQPSTLDSDDDSDDDASVARHVGRQIEREVSDTVVSDYEDEEITSVAARMRKIEISERATTDDGDTLLTTSLLTAAGSVAVSLHHTDEEGVFEIRVDDTLAAAGAPLN